MWEMLCTWAIAHQTVYLSAVLSGWEPTLYHLAALLTSVAADFVGLVLAQNDL